MHAKRLRLPFFAMLTMATVLMLTQAQAGEVRLAWDPPTTNADGTPLKDLAGYRIHWGQSSRSYNGTKQVGKGVTSVTIADLGEGKTYYFAATAFDLAGNESKYSNEVSTTIPLADTDGDSLTDRDERELYGTDPTLTDTDGDGLDDGDEAALWGSAWLDDADKDGIINLLDSDSDNDGFADGFEHSQGFDPADPTVHPNSTDVILPVQTVAASAWEAPNVPGNTLDGTLSTRWAAQGDGQWIMYDLGTLRTVSQVTAAWYQGNQRQSFFAIEVSSNGTTWTEVYSGESSGKTLKLEPYSFAAVSARYVRIIGYGNTTSRWNSLTEVEIYGQQDTGELPEPEGVLPVQTVAASAWQAPNVPANTRDKALHTRWSAEHDGQWIAYDLETPKTVSQVAIAWYQGNQRQSFFTIEVSSNGTTWTEVYSGESSGKTLKLEPYSFAAVSARYVRIVGYGNTVNQWNSLTEVEIYGR